MSVVKSTSSYTGVCTQQVKVGLQPAGGKKSEKKRQMQHHLQQLQRICHHLRVCDVDDYLLLLVGLPVGGIQKP